MEKTQKSPSTKIRRPRKTVSPMTRRSRSVSPRQSQGGNSRSNFQRQPQAISENQQIRKKVASPDTDKKALQFVALGGLEEIGRNMSYFEYKDEIILVDAGIQFPEEETPGIDFIIPNVKSLEPRKKNIKALIVTHAHFDHIGAIPYIIEKLGNPPIYTTALAKEMIIKRQSEFVNAPKLDVRVIKDKDIVKLSGYFEAEFFSVSHSVPDTAGFILKTPVGNMVSFADFKIEADESGKPMNLEKLKEIAKKDIHTAFLDSTNSEMPGWTVSERVVEKNLEDLFRNAEGRIIVGIFSTLLNRISEIIKIAEKLNKKVAFSGRSIKENVEIARRLGYIKTKKGTIISLEEISKYDDNKVLILSTGAQGESNASLMKIVTGQHRSLQLKAGDFVIFSSSVIPGNERSVQSLKDNLVRQGALVYHTKMIDIHSTGHASQEEIKTILSTVKPKFFIPIHGYLFMRTMNAQNGVKSGIPKNNIFLPDNGQIVEIKEDSVKMTKEMLPASYVMVDGLGVGDVGEVVLRDRRLLAEEGMLVIIATINRRDGKLVKNPDIISRGFIYLKENQKILNDIRSKVKNIVNNIPGKKQIDGDYLKTLFRDQIGQFVYNKTYRRPMILPVIIEI
ncbi:MAG: ribonuclease J [Candidatus Colwellbacteria bacterium]|mgnify:CR=1 FL=1|jgi:ribonuclease J|nr:ribonuclease J [Candidatus Colwellbacteria bacterium]MCK9497345.1 ribonuclease J [Candidatus Colwellbacteria bacterium]MDD3752715.1 ribonuclease J [Candidatus Colwellbacteria bacterium]MDD4818743.1 ribonuclease J [Candidatus Colwellbacteria bacterium]